MILKNAFYSINLYRDDLDIYSPLITSLIVGSVKHCFFLLYSTVTQLQISHKVNIASQNELQFITWRYRQKKNGNSRRRAFDGFMTQKYFISKPADSLNRQCHCTPQQLVLQSGNCWSMVLSQTFRSVSLNRIDPPFKSIHKWS